MSRPAMHVCHISTVHGADDPRVFRRQCAGLARRGFQVSLIIQATAPMEKEGVRIIPLPAARNRLHRLRLGWLALKHALAVDAAVYHFHDPELLPFMLLLARRTGKPVVYDVHEHYLSSIRVKPYLPRGTRNALSNGFGLIERWVVKRLAGVVTVTPQIKERYDGLGVPTALVWNYPEQDALEELLLRRDGRKRPRPPGARVVITGSLYWNRGLVEALHAIRHLLDRGIEVRLVLVGHFYPPAYETRFWQCAKDLKVEDHVEVWPRLPLDEMIDVIAGAEVGLVTYLPEENNARGLPGKLPEYIALGIPVVASDFPNYRMLVRETGAGYVVDPHDSTAVADAIARLVTDETRSRQMIEAGRKVLRDRFAWENELDVLIRFYERIAGP